MSPLRSPEWSKHAIWYQIMIDRFCNGDRSKDGSTTRPWTSSWYQPSEWEGEDGQSFYEHYVFARMYGGDLAGVRERLDYLQELGVTALYFNPIFHAQGHHKYNASDFRHIDTGYGAGEDYLDSIKDEDLLDPSTWTWTPSDQVFLDFLKECKQRDLRVVLDGVFNHVGIFHSAFVDVQKNGKDSRFADWFDITSWEPFEYTGWAGFGELPVFAKDEDGFACDAVKEHIFAITRRWMDPNGDGDPSDGIDGWRLDVPMEVAMPFWEEWSELVTSINPDAYITGEVWDSAEEWLDGKRFHAVMNYRFTAAVVAWIGHVERKILSTEFDDRLAQLRKAYPDEATSCLMNLLDSHDTDRFVSMMLNPDNDFDKGNREQEAGSTYDARRPDPLQYQKLRLAVLIQMTYVGAPMIYYGDELGMWGSDDPNNRKPMLWPDLAPYANADEDVPDEDLLAYYKRAIALRNEFPALRTGVFETILTDDEQDLWVFRRTLAHEQLLVAMTAGEAEASFDIPEAPAGTRWHPVFGPDDEGHAQVTVAGLTGRVWHAR